MKRAESFKKNLFIRIASFQSMFMIEMLMRKGAKSCKIGEVYTFLNKTHRLQGI